MQDLTFKQDFGITLNMEAAESYAKALQGDYSKSLLGEVGINSPLTTKTLTQKCTWENVLRILQQVW